MGTVATLVAGRPVDAPARPATAPAALSGRLRHAVLLGLLLALIATMRSWVSPSQHLIVGVPTDPGQFAWFLAWWPHAILHGLNPLETHLANAPFGANLMWNTSVPIAALLLAPVTLTAGPLVSYQLLVFGCLALNVVAGFALTRRLTRSSLAALAAAGLYGCSPFVAGHTAGGEPNLLLVAFPPFALALLLDAARGRRSPGRAGVLLGLATAAQLLYGEEVLTITAVGGLLLLGWLAVTQRATLARCRRPLAVTLGVAAAVALPMVAVPVGWQFLGPQRIQLPLYPPREFSLDLANLLLPNTAAWLQTGRAVQISLWSGAPAETTGYLLPALGFLWLGATRRCGRPAGRAAAGVAVLATLLATGPVWHFAGHSTGIPAPGALLAHLPLLKQVLPVRLTLLTFLATAVAAALVLDRLPGVDRQRRWLVGGVCAVSTVLWLPAWPTPAYTAFQPLGFADASLVRPGDVVAFAPSAAPGLSGLPMLWQAEAGFAWTMHSAYLISPQEERRVRQQPSDLPCLDGPVPPRYLLPETSCPPDLRRTLRRDGITVVVAGPSLWQQQLTARVTAVLGRPEQVGGLAVWRIAPPRATAVSTGPETTVARPAPGG